MIRAASSGSIDQHDAGRPPTVLLVEADEAVRDAVTAALELAGVDVIAFPSAAELIRHEPRDGADCLIVELDLFDVDARAFLRRLQDRSIQLPVIVMSARLRGLDKVEAEVQAVLEKPFGADDLLRLILGALGRRPPRRRTQIAIDTYSTEYRHPRG